MVKVNDIVRFLNDVGGGRVSRVTGNTVYVEDEDGFERPALARDGHSQRLRAPVASKE